MDDMDLRQAKQQEIQRLLWHLSPPHNPGSSCCTRQADRAPRRQTTAGQGEAVSVITDAWSSHTVKADEQSLSDVKFFIWKCRPYDWHYLVAAISFHSDLNLKKWTGLSVYVYMYMYKQICIYLLCVTPTLKTFDNYNFNNYGTQLWWNLGLVKDNLVHGLNWLQKKWLTYFFYVSLSELIVNYGLSFWYWKVNPVWKCLEPVFFF